MNAELLRIADLKELRRQCIKRSCRGVFLDIFHAGDFYCVCNFLTLYSIEIEL